MTAPFAACLARPGVVETVELRGRVGVMAFHGGRLERVTDVIATEVARRVDASSYVVHHPDDRHHVPSIDVDPAHSRSLADFLDHVDVAVALHGYGGATRARSVLLGGRNRALAHHIASHLDGRLDDHPVEVDLAAIPRHLAGQHLRNPVNRPRQHGVQVEVPAILRWHRAHNHWSDAEGVGRAPSVQALIDGLAAALASWPAP